MTSILTGLKPMNSMIHLTLEVGISSVLPTHSQNSDLGFTWHLTHTSQQIYANSRLITELCPAFLPEGIEVQDLMTYQSFKS
jgi:hypothetical protein